MLKEFKLWNLTSLFMVSSVGSVKFSVWQFRTFTICLDYFALSQPKFHSENHKDKQLRYSRQRFLYGWISFVTNSKSYSDLTKEIAALIIKNFRQNVQSLIQCISLTKIICILGHLSPWWPIAMEHPSSSVVRRALNEPNLNKNH